MPQWYFIRTEETTVYQNKLKEINKEVEAYSKFVSKKYNLPN
jgi:hypothetical protein